MSRRTFVIRPVLAGFFLVVMATAAWATKITPFIDTGTLIERAKDIVIVEVTGASVADTAAFHDGMFAVDIEILMPLKGDKAKGRATLATIYPVEKGKRYLISSLGGSAFGTDLLATAELSQVLLGEGLKLKSLEEKPLKEQVSLVFQWRLFEVTVAQKSLARERALLEKAGAPNGAE